MKSAKLLTTMSVLSQIGIKKGDRPGYRQFMYSRWVDADRWLPIPRKCQTLKAVNKLGYEKPKNRFITQFYHNNIPEIFQYGLQDFLGVLKLAAMSAKHTRFLM